MPKGLAARYGSMDVSQKFEFLGGLTLAIITLRDVFDTVVVPGGSKASLRVARRSVGLLLPIWKQMRRRSGISTTFAPTVLVLSFVVWMVLLALAFGMMAYALAASFDPPLPTLAQAVYLAGSGLVTIGLSETDALGDARWVVLGSGFCGLAVMTMAVTYLLVVQSSLAGRDKGILKLMTSAGDPPSGLRLLERYAAIGSCEGLMKVLEDGRDWCAAVQQSHLAHPSLIYFRSVGTGAGWPAALGALIDLSLIVEHCLDLPDTRGCAVLMREEGHRLASALVTLLRLRPAARVMAEPVSFADLLRRLEAAGYRIRDNVDGAAFVEAQAEHAELIGLLADHLGQHPSSLV